MQDKVSLAQRLADLPREKQEEVLQRLLKQQSTKARTIPPRNSGSKVPLTFGQQRLWLLDQIVPGNPAYNESNSLDLPYSVDVDVLRHVVTEIVRRHESLRTVIRVIDGDPIQQIQPPFELEIPLIDLRQIPPDARQREALRKASEQSNIPFDLARGPLLRASLYRIEKDHFNFVLTMHHLICDGWSMGVFMIEFFVLYWSFILKKPSPLPELPIQYGDFAVWQRSYFDRDFLAPQLAYWRKQLANLSQLELPADRPRAAQFTFRGARHPLLITNPLYQSLADLCEREGVTLFILLLAAFYILLHRYTSQDDIVVGTPIAGRDRKELEPLIGFFVNTLLLRADLSQNPRFLDFLKQVRDTLLSAYSNQDVPFEQLVEELHPPRDESRNPLFQVAFQLFQRPSAHGLKRDLLQPFTPVESGIAKFDLSFELLWTESSVKGYIEYCTDLFSSSRIERMAGHYLRLLESIVEQPDRQISRLELLTREEEKQLLREWNSTESDYPRDSCVHAEFDSQVQSNPKGIAVQFGGARRTYEEVKCDANRISAALLARGIRKGQPVGLLMERCIDLPAAMLGILKAGGAFVPLDPAYPRERLSYLVSDSRVRLILTSKDLVAHFLDPSCEMLAVEDVTNTSGPVESSHVDTEAESLAYVMYTSGTTGNPKGVAITHRNILRLVKGARYATFGSGQNLLQFSPVSFDASTFEIWGSLLNGGTLVVYPPGTPSLEELGAFIKHERIDLLFLTTSLFRQMVENNPGDLRSVRQILTGGEQMALSTAVSAWNALPRTRIVNVYGPTECTAFASAYPISSPEFLGTIVPIGKPIENTTFYILDRYGNAAPIGAPGELYIGGDGVAQGYWRRDDLTSSTFLADSFGQNNRNGRLYRTGDMAVYRDDGNVVFLGRRDRQIKLNGYRIELGEVEAAIAAHPEVSYAAVILLGDDPKQLTAFVEVLPNHTLSFAELRQFLLEKLPHYMIPTHLELCEKLPLSSNRKIDYSALQRQTRTAASGNYSHAPPATVAEQQLIAIWEELLQAKNIGIHDSFFDLGGQSLIATRVLSRVRELFQAQVTMRDFFNHPTVAGLAQLIARNGTRPESTYKSSQLQRAAGKGTVA